MGVLTGIVAIAADLEIGTTTRALTVLRRRLRDQRNRGPHITRTSST